MASPFDRWRFAVLTPEEQTQLLNAADQVRRTALPHLDANRNTEYVIRFITNLQRGVDSMVLAALESGPQFDCKAGCNHCCRVRVEALEPEVFQIARELKKQAPDRLKQLIFRLNIYVSGITPDSAGQHDRVCPFLEHELCSIYSVRPAVCRKAHSLDVTQCQKAGADIPQSLALILQAEALMKGTATAYHQIQLAASGHELGQAVLLALSDDTAESRWIAGEAVFDVEKF